MYESMKQSSDYVRAARTQTCKANFGRSELGRGELGRGEHAQPPTNAWDLCAGDGA